MRSSQRYRHTSRRSLPVLAREERPTYGSGPDDPCGTDVVGEAVAAILTGDGKPLPEGELAELVATLRVVDRLTSRAVTLASRLDGRRAAAEEGMTVDAALRLHTGAAGSDVSMVLTAAEVLASMPAAAALFARGVLSWGHVRSLVAGARRLDTATRSELDDHLARNADQLAAMDADRRSWAIEDAIADHQPERRLERQAERQADTEFLALQGRLDGSGSVYGEFGPESFATITGRLQDEADAPRAQPCPGDHDAPADVAPTRGQQLADALVRLCGRRDGTGGGSAVRFSVIVDVDRVTDRAAGHIVAAVRGRPPRIVRRALDRLACDAALDVVIRDGVDLLAAQRYAPEVTAATRRAVAVRDGGCRFPGCTAPISWCDVHHVTPRAAEGDPRAVDGDHHLQNVVSLCRQHHTTVHRRGWHQTLTPDGTYQLRRRGRRWTTLPRTAAQLAPPTGSGTRSRAGPAPRAGPVSRAKADPDRPPPDPAPLPF
ncbi:MAG: hypothetical protein WEB03_15635 [Nitriliruptor sp.]|uniref:hypothetical protein n=1 Tax=Nitriliruptor sp. TaxID=2448056 RepID=UPI0034A048ED